MGQEDFKKTGNGTCHAVEHIQNMRTALFRNKEQPVLGQKGPLSYSGNPSMGAGNCCSPSFLFKRYFQFLLNPK